MFKKNFYKIKKEEFPLYQHYISELLMLVNISNLTKWANKEDYNKDLYISDTEKIFAKLDEVKKENLVNSFYLQIMFDQYVFADPWIRERHQKAWPEKVVNREKVDFFPDPAGLAASLYVLDE